MTSLRIVCLSDTHGLHDSLEVPDGDLLLHAGDFTNIGEARDVARFGEFLALLPHKHKIVIAGNHDFLFEREPERARELLGDVTYLRDEEASIEGVRIWGSPWQPWFHDWAFNLPRGKALAEKWALIPDGTDILMTHGPPLGHLDRTAQGEAVGCEDLRKSVERIRPRMHLFGHIHEGYGAIDADSTLSINACSCDLRYRPVNAPIVVHWDEHGPRIDTE